MIHQCAVIAYGFRYYYMPGLKHILSTFTLIPHRHRCSYLPSPSPSLVSLSSSFHLPNPDNLSRFLTGNCPFFKMERYWSGSGVNKNKAMVEHLQHYGVITSKKVSEVMETIDRACFVPDGTPPYVDSPMAIGYNATISAPHMHATCLQLLEENLKPGMHALDIGSDGRKGWPEFAPYDAIHVGAAAPEIPQALIDQLKPGGRMVIPVGNIFQDLKVVDKNQDGSLSVWSETSVRYVPLTSRDAQLRGW
ncbi:protein-L-isoaspartate O-methyltransferase 1 isoform X3 [Citrus sinensis]|uniref:protein-L-isoaspartate O-methyltransferase 1 isoform X3 n=1 Tax=Citrus sinensis TaxID=2711 RepID=UPI00227925A6|nr:protein-L-isoaspartate O-methyltransferase 1 isoform X3 [Citrus sinensis]